MLSFDEIQHRVSQWMGKKRFKHTLGVVESATQLAKLYDVDVEKARLAALLHDCAKEMPLKEMQDLVKENNYKADEELLANGNLLHGLAGMIRAKLEFSITDSEILEAIRVHTTGKVGMSTLDKVIFLADYIEPNRREIPGLSKIRQIVFQNIDQAICLSSERTIRYLEDNGNKIDPMTIKTYEFYGGKL